MIDNDNNSPPPSFDLDEAKTMLNKLLLIGISYHDSDGKFLEQKQMHGLIVDVNEHLGFKIALKGSRDGEFYTLPPDLRSFHVARPGSYREHSTGEIVVNPDFTTTWQITKNSTKKE